MLLIVALREYLRPAFGADDGSACVLTHGQYATGRYICILHEVNRDKTIIRRCFWIVNNSAKLFKMARA